MNHWNWNEGKDLLDHTVDSLVNADLFSTVCPGCFVQSLKDLSNWGLRFLPEGKAALGKGPQCCLPSSNVSIKNREKEKEKKNHPIYMVHTNKIICNAERNYTY